MSCPQCGLTHPPLQPGERCPMAKEKANDGSVIDTANFINQLKIICTNQIRKKDIKNHKKLFGQIIISVTKQLEEYQE